MLRRPVLTTPLSFDRRSTVNIPAGPTEAAVMDCAYGLARYAAICQDNGLVPIVEPEILLDGEHDIDRTLAVAEKTWAATFKYLADFGVMFEGILLKPSMVTPGADNKKKESPERVAEYTLKMLKRRVPPAVPGIMFLSGGQSELEASLNLNAMNKSPNPWHVSFSYARALQNTVLKTWMGKDGNKKAAQDALLRRAKANSDAQLGKFVPTEEDKKAIESTYQKNYSCAPSFALHRCCFVFRSLTRSPPLRATATRAFALCGGQAPRALACCDGVP
jgi:fructose-bisphosphate aldolase class I